MVNFDMILEVFMIGFGTLMLLLTFFLSVRFFVCLARSERRDPWSFPLALGWLMVFLSFFIPSRVTDVPYEINLPGVVASEAFTIIVTVLWFWAVIAYALTTSNWGRRHFRMRQLSSQTHL